MDIEEILADYRPPGGTLPVCLRADLQSEWDRLEREFHRADTEISDDVLPGGSSARAAKIAREMEQVRREMQEGTRVFRLQGVPRPRWHQLVDAHAADGTDGVDEETFGVAIVAACCADPVMSVEQAERLRDAVTDGQWEEIGKEVMRLNRTSPSVPYSAQVAARVALAGA